MNTLIFTLFFTIWHQSTGLMVTVTDTGLLVSVLFNWLRLNSPAGIPIRYLRLRANHNFALTHCAWIFPVNCLTLKLGKDRIGNLLCEPSTDVPATDGPARSLIRTKFREGTWMINANVHKAVCWLFILALEPHLITGTCVNFRPFINIKIRSLRVKYISLTKRHLECFGKFLLC